MTYEEAIDALRNAVIDAAEAGCPLEEIRAEVDGAFDNWRHG